MTFSLTTSAFEPGGRIPLKYTCLGANVSPTLKWTEPPAKTLGFVLICDDPDAPMGTWVHWVVYDLPPTVKGLGENMPKTDIILSSGKQGINDFRKTGYDGPMPPPGKPHRYFFTLYAVDQLTGLQPRATKIQVLKAIGGHVLAESKVMGTFQRE